MGLFDSLKSANSTSNNENMRPSPVEEFFGPALYAVDCRGANLYVHESVVVIDKTGADYGTQVIIILKLYLLNLLLRYKLN